MLELDGAAGGGQFLRSALTLSVLTGRPFRMDNVRGGRPTPGLKPQHRTAVDLAARLCDAETAGHEIGSETVTFRPGSLRGGDVAVDVGTAGSVTLLVDTVLPLALGLDEPLSISLVGGTDVKWSPSVGYHRHVKLPLLRRHGLNAALDLDRTGFYPTGGGEVTLWLAPSTVAPLDLTARGPLLGGRVYSTASMDLSDREVAERQADAAIESLRPIVSEMDDASTGASGATDDRDGGGEIVERTVSWVSTRSPGSSLVVRLDYAGSVVGFDALGERGKPAEDVAIDAVEAAVAFHDGPATVDAHMADQLVAFLAICGGRVRIPRVTDHVETGLDLVGSFGFDVGVDQSPEGPVLIGEGAD